MQPSYIPEVLEVENRLLTVPIMDRIVARDLAYREFDRLVVSNYEEYCITKSGLVEEYLRAFQKQKESDELLSKETR